MTWATGAGRGIPRILVLRALGLGDLLTTVPALRALRRAFGEAEITLAAPRALAPIVHRMGAADRLLHTVGLEPLRWDGPPPSLAVNLHGRGPESIDLLRRVRPEQLLTHAHPARPAVDGPPWQADRHEVRRWCDVLAYAGIPADPDDLALPRRHDPPAVAGPVIIHPGASHAARQWPPERYGAVARFLVQRGHRVVVAGSAVERPLARRVAAVAGMSSAEVLAGRTGLDGLADLVADARLVICGDTGIAHLATAYGTPSVVLFGPVSPALWGPPHRPRHRALWRGRTGDTFADRPDPGLLEIDVADVIDAVGEVLGAAEGGESSCVPTGSGWSAPVTSD
ncbi:glycosyltransferase family 9 protein [Pseudonocardia acidicola]|uniref:Glycosyltransferase family 9 protein n=1 Tax=Pseudonocardia acidicola TaxID=2724939 RepID=A0ABX1SDD9_9PSEU|nr:glycosyltransferase family 9 protein [Pseudonocardia acidicola]NMH98371.1 glycosyltransferase family 9 protein [Pseudonocardia acidicola]